MSQRLRLLALGLLGFSAFVLAGARLVPFHPDETSLLFQSRDLEQYFTDPRSLAYSPSSPPDQAQLYRALNAPLAKYVLGVGRLIAGYSSQSVAVDWDWSETWSANLARGAMPPQRLLNGARLAVTLLLPATLLFAYLTGAKLGGVAVGALTAGLLGLNALFLLHGRRAMMEGAMFFGLCFALWATLNADRRPWLAGAAAAMAVSAKHSLLPMLVLAALGAYWTTHQMPGPRVRLANLGKLALAAALTFAVLNPFFWIHPIAAGVELVEERAGLAAAQLQTQQAADFAAMQLPMSASDRLAAFLGQVFFSEPQFSEAANYRAEINSQIVQYSGVPGHNWLRGWLAGGALFGLTLFGTAAAGVSLRRLDTNDRRITLLLLIGTLGMGLVLLLGIPFPFQRYYLPLLPFTSLWSAYAVVELTSQSKRLLSSRAAHS